MARFFEIAESDGRRIDKAQGVIRDVKVCGQSSRNNREYSPQALRDIAAKAEGANVCLDHDKANPGNRREAEAWGTLRNVHVVGDEVRGDLHYIKSHGDTPRLLERIERGIGRIGLSIAAEGRSNRRGERMIVEAVDKVFSVDLVSGPATVDSLFEDTSHYHGLAGLHKTTGFQPSPTPARVRRAAKAAQHKRQAAAGISRYIETIYEETAGDGVDEVAAAFESAAVAVIKARQPLDATLDKLRHLLAERDAALGKDGEPPAPAKDFDTGLAGASVDAEEDEGATLSESLHVRRDRYFRY